MSAGFKEVMAQLSQIFPLLLSDFFWMSNSGSELPQKAMGILQLLILAVTISISKFLEL